MACIATTLALFVVNLANDPLKREGVVWTGLQSGNSGASDGCVGWFGCCGPYRASQDNPDISRLYDDFYGKPNSDKAHHLLHTTYKKFEYETVVGPELELSRG